MSAGTSVEPSSAQPTAPHDFKVGDRVRVRITEHQETVGAIALNYRGLVATVIVFGRFSPSLADIRFDGRPTSERWHVSLLEHVNDDATGAGSPRGAI